MVLLLRSRIRYQDRFGTEIAAIVVELINYGDDI